MICLEMIEDCAFIQQNKKEAFLYYEVYSNGKVFPIRQTELHKLASFIEY